MTREIMLQCLWDAKWVFVEYDRGQRFRGREPMPSLAQIAAALYQVKMTRLENETYLREVNDALFRPQGGE